MLAAGGACGLQAARAAPAFTVQQVAPGDYVHLGSPVALTAAGHDDIANIGFIVGTRCVAVIDAGGSVGTARALLGALRSHTTLPVCFVINTHVHVDHVLGDVAFRQPGTEFVGHEKLAAALSGSREFFLRNYAADLDAPATAAQIITPDRTVPAGQDLELDLGGRRLRLHAWPAAHTDSDLSVLDEATMTLWTGDLLFIGRTPAIDGSIKGWLGVMDQLGALAVKHVVPGHGAPGTDLPAALAPQRRYLEALLAAVRGELAAGKPLQQALAEVSTGRGDWLLWEETQPHNVARVYQELEWE